MEYYRLGQSLLALVILIGGILLAGGVALSFATFSSIDSMFAFQSAQQAETVATAGVEDALLQLARNNTFSNTDGYLVSVGSSTATVIVTTDSPAPDLSTIVSSAVVSSQVKRIQVVAVVNSITGRVSIRSWTNQ